MKGFFPGHPRAGAQAVLAGLLLAAAGLALPVAAATPAPQRHSLEALRTPVSTRYLLVGPDGQAVTDEDFRGRLQLIAFGYTFCPDVCPTTLVEMAEILKALGDAAGRVQPLFVSLDPERDTPAALKTYTRFFDPRIIGLSGSPELIKRAAGNFRVRYAKVHTPGNPPEQYAVDHSAGMFLLGADGQLLRKFAFGRPLPDVIAEIRTALGINPPAATAAPEGEPER